MALGCADDPQALGSAQQDAGASEDAPSPEAPAPQDTGEETDATEEADATEETGALADAADPEETNPCAFPLVKLRTGPDESCSGGNEHHWPVGMAPEDCHGWSATAGGREHLNSANTIQCNEDGTFEFTQFAGNLDCSGTGVRKVYSLDECQQDIPPRLYTLAFDLACCAAPDSPECQVGAPLVTVPGGTVFLNGESCAP